MSFPSTATSPPILPAGTGKISTLISTPSASILDFAVAVSGFDFLVVSAGAFLELSAPSGFFALPVSILISSCFGYNNDCVEGLNVATANCVLFGYTQVLSRLLYAG